jgi:hypothetical protein
MSIESFSLLVDLVGPEIEEKIQIFIQLCQQKKEY